MGTKIAIGIIIVTFTVSCISPYLIIFAGPLFIVGVVLLWLGRRKIRTKILWTILPIVLWYPVFMLVMLLFTVIGNATSQKLDIIFANGFKGEVKVIENMVCGQPINKKDGREQLFVPSNGVLLYQGEIKAGYINHRYYYQLENGKLAPLPELSQYMFFDGEKKQPRKDVVGVWLGGLGETMHSNQSTLQYSWMTFTVNSKDSFRNIHDDFQREKEFENIIDSLVRDCVGNR